MTSNSRPEGQPGEDAWGAAVWVSVPLPNRFVGGVFIRATLPYDLANDLATLHADHLVRCFVDPANLPTLAEHGGASQAETFARFLPRKPHVRSGDFGEILFSLAVAARDTPLRFPLYRWRLKMTPDSPVQGVDLIGYVMKTSQPSPDDTLVLCEVKTCAKRKRPTIAKTAVTAIQRDFANRLCDQLLFQHDKLLSQGLAEEAARIARFRFSHLYPGGFRKRLIAGLVQDSAVWSDEYLDALPPQVVQEAGVDVQLALVCVDRLTEWFAVLQDAAVAAVDQASAASSEDVGVVKEEPTR